MEFEVTLKLSIDPNFFYWDASASDRTEIVLEMVHNAVYDLDEVTIKNVEVEQVN